MKYSQDCKVSKNMPKYDCGLYRLAARGHELNLTSFVAISLNPFEYAKFAKKIQNKGFFRKIIIF